MAFKERTKSKQLRTYEILSQRRSLEKEDYYYSLNHNKGHEGECRYDKLTVKLEPNCVILNDLQLEVRHSSFQVDPGFPERLTIKKLKITIKH